MKKIQVVDLTIKASVENLKKDLSFREKLSVAKNLERLGVDAIELPTSCKDKEQLVVSKTISESVANSTIVISCDDQSLVESTFESIRSAKNKRIQIAFPVSTAIMEYNYHLKAPKMLEKIAQTIKTASSTCQDVEFVAIDATRAEEGFLTTCAKVAKDNGANIITLRDDGGVAFPNEFAKLVKEIKDNCDIQVFVQPSDKLKMASAIAVEVISAGADGIKTAVGVENYLSPDTLSEIIRAKGDTLGVTTSLDVTAMNKITKEIAHVSGKL